MDFKQWQTNIEADLVGLSDSSYQQACFSGQKVSADTSPAEMIATLYDDDLLRDFVDELVDSESHSAGLALLQAIQYLTSNIDLSSEDWESVVRSHEWIAVMASAARLLKCIQRH